jgi:hypothetical protein
VGCMDSTLCVGTFAVFFPLFTVGCPFSLLFWMRHGFTEAGHKRLKAAVHGDEEAFKKEVARYKARFGFFTSKYEAFYWSAQPRGHTHTVPTCMHTCYIACIHVHVRAPGWVPCASHT